MARLGKEVFKLKGKWYGFKPYTRGRAAEWGDVHGGMFNSKAAAMKWVYGNKKRG